MSGCSKKQLPSAIQVVPEGTFAGLFRRVHISGKTGVRDTLKANVQLILDKTAGFSLTASNTSSVIVPSHGGYVIDSNYILFNDITYQVTASATPTDKVHLTGTYQFYYNVNNKVFQMVNNSFLDTLSLQFDLKKTN